MHQKSILDAEKKVNEDLIILFFFNRLYIPIFRFRGIERLNNGESPTLLSHAALHKYERMNVLRAQI